jgi:hypothetical protein
MAPTAMCPGCGFAMDSIGLPARYGRVVQVDVCAGCGGLWFDDKESQQLSPGGTLTLLERLTLRPTRPLHGRSPCPRCRQTMQEVSDQQRATRFTYRRCPSGHGRFITAYHFLREKHLVRELTLAEVSQLREAVRQVNCVNCGAPVTLGQTLTCAHCATPVSMVDPQQLRRELAILARAASDARQIDPTLPIRLAHERAAAERTWAGLPDQRSWVQDVLLQDSAGGSIVQAAIRLLSTRVG